MTGSSVFRCRHLPRMQRRPPEAGNPHQQSEERNSRHVEEGMGGCASLFQTGLSKPKAGESWCFASSPFFHALVDGLPSLCRLSTKSETRWRMLITSILCLRILNALRGRTTASNSLLHPRQSGTAASDTLSRTNSSKDISPFVRCAAPLRTGFDASMRGKLTRRKRLRSLGNSSLKVGRRLTIEEKQKSAAMHFCGV